MSEQKMPALPDWCEIGGAICIARGTVQRIQREAYEAGRQQERERMEPLRVAVESVSAAREMMRAAINGGSMSSAHSAMNNARSDLEAAARTLLEQTE